jgi:hypothetical protein
MVDLRMVDSRRVDMAVKIGNVTLKNPISACPARSPRSRPGDGHQRLGALVAKTVSRANSASAICRRASPSSNAA